MKKIELDEKVNHLALTDDQKHTLQSYFIQSLEKNGISYQKSDSFSDLASEFSEMTPDILLFKVSLCLEQEFPNKEPEFHNHLAFKIVLDFLTYLVRDYESQSLYGQKPVYFTGILCHWLQVLTKENQPAEPLKKVQ